MTDRLQQLLKNGKLHTICMAAAVLLVLGILFLPKNTKTENPLPAVPEYTAEEYIAAEEARIAKMVSAITGERSPFVCITLKTMGETRYATENRNSEKSTEEYNGNALNRTQSDGDHEQNYILLKTASGGQEALVLSQIQPEVLGVVVISQYGENVVYRERIMNAVKTAYHLSATQVCVAGHA